MELFGRIAFEAEHLRPFLPTYLHLLASALFPIYIGAHASLSIPSSAAPPAKKDRGDDEFSDNEPEVAAETVEGLTPKDALLFPLLAGLTLSSLYFIIKWLEDPSILNKVLSFYFLQVGIVFGTKFLKDVFSVLRSICLPNQYEYGGEIWRVNRLEQRYDAAKARSDNHEAYQSSPLPGILRRLPIPSSITNRIWKIRSLLYAKCSLNIHIHRLVTVKLPVDILDALAVIASIAVVGVFTFIYKPWYVSNLLGFAFCYGSTQFMSPTTFWTGTLLLSALFVYDIYFVFFTPMMVTVATKLDIPIKLLFPRPPSPGEAEKGVPGLAMLGLGDIVIPGMMVALALRFDLYLHYLRISKTIDGTTEKAKYVPVTGGWGERFWVGRSAAGPDLQAKAFPKTYFKVGLIGYTLGMIVTLLVMQVAEHAQPALLYLVPGVLTALWCTAFLKGDLNHMWDYTEDKEAGKDNTKSNVTKDKVKRKVEEKRTMGKTPGERGEASARTETKSAGGDSTKEKHGGENDELATASTTAKEDVNGTSDSEGDSQSSSNSSSDGDSDSDSGSGSDSDSNSDTPSSSQSNQAKSAEQKADKILKNKKEEHCRHLIWFSIDFPPSTHPSESRPPSMSARTTKKGTTKEATSTIVSPFDSEPPGKRRRVR
jgi:minor histocompatibility antigen H13